MPQNEVHVWMVEQAAIISIRVERCQRIERRCRDKISLRAELTWDDDRRLAAEILGRSLGKDPAETVESLRKTPAGCDWLMSRWALLAHAADAQESGWTEDQTKLAFDLLATPHAFRLGRSPGLSIDFEGRVTDSDVNPASVARREVALLKERRAVVENLDEVDRVLASTDLTNEGDGELRRLRRYESAMHSRMRWCLKQITIQSPYRQPDPTLRPEWSLDNEPETELDVEPELKPEPKSADDIAAEGWTPALISPPFDLTPDEYSEPGQKINMEAILKSRRNKKLAKAEATRQDRRRRVDKLRA